MNVRSLILAAAIAASVVAGPVDAAERAFRLSGDIDAYFVLPLSPIPLEIDPQAFSVYSAEGIVNGVSNDLNLAFYTVSAFGGFDLTGATDDSIQFQFSGPQLFSGSTAAPTFVNGTYSLLNLNSESGNYTLVISYVPEPASWAMLIAGFGLTGAALRRRQRAIA